jgi:hypothetical protein
MGLTLLLLARHLEFRRLKLEAGKKTEDDESIQGSRPVCFVASSFILIMVFNPQAWHP